MPADEFNQYCENLLVRYNRRNTGAITRRIEDLCGFLRRQGDVVQTMFGGSVRRGTYVSGLSDVDVLLIVNESSLVNRPPAEVIGHVRDTIRRRFPLNTVTAGDLAVSVQYADETQIQVLPAIRTRNGGTRIAEPGATNWSSVIRPENFARKLTEINGANGGRIVPTIKLAKATFDCFIRNPSRRITGYHMESLAIEAFTSYGGPLDPTSMLIHLFGNSIRAVMTPIVDSTGQSRFVDEYLGPGGSRQRQRASTYFGQMRARVRSSRTRRDMDRLFCEGAGRRRTR